ncbi:DUF397 domain-containing protein [Spirillospora sp. CA-294931]|uniref:DUF397 domain-containing protein n=1 Tax=Spirillospora sp. CA-294931 TaxID=3240042 RepID=UPI003D8F740D
MTLWRKSSYSGGSGTTDCVELAQVAGGVGVRDSRAPERGHLTLSQDSARALARLVKRGGMDLR